LVRCAGIDRAPEFGKAKCAECHPAPYYTDNSMHNLRVERFFKARMINERYPYLDVTPAGLAIVSYADGRIVGLANHTLLTDKPTTVEVVVPTWAGRSYQHLMEELEALEEDVLEHVHLEAFALVPRLSAAGGR